MEIKQKLTKKEQAFVDYYLSSPKISATEAALFAYNTTNPVVAASIGYENLRKHHVEAYMMSVSELAERTILQVVREWGESENPRKRELALKAAYWVHDKATGRATANMDVKAPTVHQIAINLTGDGDEAPSDMNTVPILPS